MNKTITMEKEVWESTLKASMDRAGRIEILEQQLAIAVKRLKFLQKKTAAPYDLRAYKPIYEMVTKTLQQIKELEK